MKIMSDLKTIAIIQSNYIPWKGYFDIIHSVDEFVLYDDAQFTERDWRNRNRTKTQEGLKWLTIPVELKESSPRRSKTRVSATRIGAASIGISSAPTIPMRNISETIENYLRSFISPAMKNI